MNKRVRNIVKKCDTCQRVKYLNKNVEGNFGHIVSENPGDLVTVDFYGSLPKSRGKVQYIFVIIDAFSKYVKLYPMVKANTRNTLNEILKNYIVDAGRKPKKVSADNGTQFTSKIWREELNSRGIKTGYCSIRHPQSNLTERVMRELGRMFRVLCSDAHSAWAQHVQNVEDCLNYTHHMSTGHMPYEVQFGKTAPDKINEIITFPEDGNINDKFEQMINKVRNNLTQKYKSRELAQKNNKPEDIEVEDLVLVRVPHTSNLSDGTVHKFRLDYERNNLFNRKY